MAPSLVIRGMSLLIQYSFKGGGVTLTCCIYVPFESKTFTKNHKQKHTTTSHHTHCGASSPQMREPVFLHRFTLHLQIDQQYHHWGSSGNTWGNREQGSFKGTLKSGWRRGHPQDREWELLPLYVQSVTILCPCWLHPKRVCVCVWRGVGMVMA